MQQIISLLLLGTVITACASGNVSERADKTVVDTTVKVKEFTSLDVSTGITVNFTQGALAPAKVKAPRYMLEHLQFKNDKGELEIYLDKDFFQKYHSSNGKVTITLSAPAVRIFETASAGTINVSGPLSVKGNAGFDVSSASAISLPDGVTATGKLTVDASSAARINFGSISSASCTIDASSGSGISVGSIKAGTLVLDASSGSSVSFSDATLNSSSFDLSSGAGCTIRGKANSVKVDTSSGASFNGERFRTLTASGDASSGSSIKTCADKSKVEADITASVKNCR